MVNFIHTLLASSDYSYIDFSDNLDFIIAFSVNRHSGWRRIGVAKGNNFSSGALIGRQVDLRIANL